MTNISDSQSYNTLYEWKFESSKTKVPRRKIYDFCIKKDEEKINVLEADWTSPENRRTSEVVAKWYQARGWQKIKFEKILNFTTTPV